MNLISADLSTWTFPFCPRPPDWTLDWPRLVASFEWVQAMRGCRQDPLWHAEGDVFIHTQMVCQALADCAAWRELPPVARSVVFAATLMHDIAKPHCTREEDGRIISRGHSRQGARMARQVISTQHPQLLNDEIFGLREMAVALVRHHGLPLYFCDEQNPQRALIEASQMARLDWLALVAEADVRGRACADQSELLERVELFRELARENGCFDQPYRFASDHSRFLYFQRDGLPPDYEAYDDTRLEAVLMSGLPGAGKDTWIQKNLPAWPVVSLDDTRRKMGVSPQDDQGAVASATRECARAHLRAGTNFIWNATNTTRRMRNQLVGLFHGYRARVRIVYVEATPAEIRERNRRRAEPVPEAVLDKLLDRLDVPDCTEAHIVATCIW